MVLLLVDLDQYMQSSSSLVGWWIAQDILTAWQLVLAVSQASLPLCAFILKEDNHFQGHKGEKVEAARSLEAEHHKWQDAICDTLYWSVASPSAPQGEGNQTSSLNGRNGKFTLQKMVASIFASNLLQRARCRVSVMKPWHDSQQKQNLHVLQFTISDLRDLFSNHANANLSHACCSMGAISEHSSAIIPRKAHV